MKKTIIISSTQASAGKSAVAIGLYLKMKEQDIDVGYFKPIGDSMEQAPKSRADKDVSVISAVVQRQYSKEEICPQFFTPEYVLDEVYLDETAPINQKISDTFSKMQSKADVIIIEGNHSISQYSSLGLDDIQTAKKFNANMIIITPIQDDNNFNQLVSTYQHSKLAGINVLGVIMNAMSPTAEVRITRYYNPILEALNIPNIGFLKNSRELEKPTIAEIMDATGSKLISGEFIRVKDRLVNTFMIGAMQRESALSHFRKGVDKCVITGGDRSDLALAALETSTKAILFTGNMPPNKRVISAAEQKDIPLLVSPNDTFTVAEQIKNIKTKIQPSEIEICRELIENLDWNKIIQ